MGRTGDIGVLHFLQSGIDSAGFMSVVLIGVHWLLPFYCAFVTSRALCGRFGFIAKDYDALAMLTKPVA
jgi:hypothetical protein